MTTQQQLTDYLSRVRKFAHAQTQNNPLETMPDIQAYPGLAKQPVRGLVDREVAKVFVSLKLEWPKNAPE